MLTNKGVRFVQLVTYLVVGSGLFGLGYWAGGNSVPMFVDQQMIDVQDEKNDLQARSLSVAVQTDRGVTDDFGEELLHLKRALAEEQQKNREVVAALLDAKRSLSVTQDREIAETECASLSEKVEFGLSQEAMRDLYSTDLAIRKRAFLALAQLQNTDAKSLLVQLAQNEQEDAGLRRDVIRSMDWHGAIEQAIQVFNTSKDESVKAAVIFAAQDSRFDAIEKQNFESELMNMFTQETSGFIQIVMLDYFSSKNAEIYLMLSEKVSNGEISVLDDVKRHSSFATIK